MIPKRAGDVLKGATIRRGGLGDAMGDGIKIQVWVRTATFGQTVCELAVSPSSECTVGIITMSDWGTQSLPSTVSLKQRRIPGGQTK